MATCSKKPANFVKPVQQRKGRMHQQIDCERLSVFMTRVSALPTRLKRLLAWCLSLFVAGVGLGVPAASADPGDSWTAHSAAESHWWSSVAHGGPSAGKQFVAVARGSYDGSASDYVMTSPDGEVWTAREAHAGRWLSVAYGNGRWVAVRSDLGGSSQSVMTSEDGITWTLRTAPRQLWSSVTYGGLPGEEKFVAVADYPHVMTSDDGINWAFHEDVLDGGAETVTYGDGQFVAIAPSGERRAMTSQDGVTWTAHTLIADEDPSQYAPRSVTFGNGMFVAVAIQGEHRIVTSTDGQNWISQPEPTNAVEGGRQWRHVTFGDGVFVAVSQIGTHRIMTSNNGTDWKSYRAPEANSWVSVTHGNGRFVSVAYDGQNQVKASGEFIPSPPPAPTVTPGDTAATISIAAGSGPGGAATEYTATASPGGATCTINTAPGSCTITGLTNGTPYTFTVTASNNSGTSDPSATSAPITPATAPEPEGPSEPPPTDDGGTSNAPPVSPEADTSKPPVTTEPEDPGKTAEPTQPKTPITGTMGKVQRLKIVRIKARKAKVKWKKPLNVNDMTSMNFMYRVKAKPRWKNNKKLAKWRTRAAPELAAKRGWYKKSLKRLKPDTKYVVKLRITSDDGAGELTKVRFRTKNRQL